MTMTSSDPGSSASAAPVSSSAADRQPPPQRTPLPRVIALILVFVIIGMYALWYSGMLQPRPKVALVTANSSGPYWEAIIRGAQDAADRYKIRLTVVRSSGDTQQQTDQVSKLLEEHYDGIAVSPQDPPHQAAVLAQAATQSRLVTFDSDSLVSGKLCFVGTDNYDAGRMAGKQLKEALPDGGGVIISVGTVDKENGQRRRQGVIDELLDRSFEPQRPMDPLDGAAGALKGPKFTIVATLTDGIDPGKATDLAAAALKSHPDVKAFACLYAYSTPSVLKALSDAGKSAGAIKIVGFDTNDETLKGIEDGSVVATMMQSPWNIGFESVRILGDAARGDTSSLPMFQSETLACDLVTKSNLETIRAQLASRGGNKLPATRPTASAGE